MIRIPATRWLAGALVCIGVSAAQAAGPYLIVSGRWDNTVVIIDMQKAMDPTNDGTTNAIINRVRVTPDIDTKGSGAKDTPASGQPVNVVMSPDNRLAYIVNHSGTATPDARSHPAWTRRHDHGPQRREGARSGEPYDAERRRRDRPHA